MAARTCVALNPVHPALFLISDIDPGLGTRVENRLRDEAGHDAPHDGRSMGELQVRGGDAGAGYSMVLDAARPTVDLWPTLRLLSDPGRQLDLAAVQQRLAPLGMRLRDFQRAALAWAEKHPVRFDEAVVHDAARPNLHADDLDALMIKADLALYKAKTGGKNQIQVFHSDMDTERSGYQRARLDAGNPVYDASRQRMLLTRNGDLFVRDLRSGALTQLTRSNDAEQQARFARDGAVIWRTGNTWYRWTAGAGCTPRAVRRCAAPSRAARTRCGAPSCSWPCRARACPRR